MGDHLDRHSISYIHSLTSDYPTVQNVVNLVAARGVLNPLPVNEALLPPDWKDTFLEGCINVPVDDSCISLITAFNGAFNSILRQSDESEMQLITIIDACLHIFNVIMKTNNKRGTTITTSGRCMPDYSTEYKKKYPLTVGEDKLQRNYRKGEYGHDPLVELLTKSPLTQWKMFYGNIPFIFGYHVVGSESTSVMEFGLIHPSPPYFTPLFHEDIVNTDGRCRFCFLLLKLLPVLKYLMRVANNETALGLGWTNSSVKPGFLKTLKVVVMDRAPVLEIAWTPIHIPTFQQTIDAMRPVYDVLCKRNHINVLRYHRDHQGIETVISDQGSLLGYKCFLVPFGRPVAISTNAELKACLISVCRELQDIHAKGIVFNDIRWANICQHQDDNNSTIYFLVDFDDAREIQQSNNICPGIPNLDTSTHFNVHIPHSFETDLWAIGNLLNSLSEVSFRPTTEQRNLGMEIMMRIQNRELLSLDNIIERIEHLPA